MKEKDNRVTRWPLNITVLLILLPMLLSSQWRRFVSPDFIQSMIEGGRWLSFFVVVLAIVLFAASFVYIFWKGRLLVGIIGMIVIDGLLVVFVLSVQKGEEAGERRLYIMSEPGIGVYCNDVNLGKTPLEISKEEFHHKVKPWDKPPRQNMILGHGEEFINENKIRLRQLPKGPELRWIYIPYHYFSQHLGVGQPRVLSYNHSVKSGYWWQFERDGCSGFAAINEMVGSSQDSLNLRIWANPLLHYPSVEPYVEHLLHKLKQSHYQPSVEWRTLVGNSSGLLFQHLYEIGQRDSRVMRALELAIETEFNIREGMSAEGWESVMEEISSRVEKHHTLSMPSPEFMAMDLMIRHNMELIETRFLDLLSQPMDSGSMLGLRDGLSVLMYGSSEASVFKLLEYAVLKNSPPALFNRLVYESRRGERFLSMVGNYSSKEALKIVRQYLDDVVHPNPVVNFISPVSGQMQQRKALEVAAYLRNPALEAELRRFMLKHAHDDSPASQYYLHEFITARLERSLTEAEAGSLAEWIAEAAPLPESEKLRFLTRLNSSHTYRSVRNMVLQTASIQYGVIRNLINHPNLWLDRLLIEIYQAKSAGVKFGGIVPITAPRKVINVSSDLIRAMVLCDTPRVRDFLVQLWKSSDANKIDLLEAIKVEAPRHFPHLYDWIPLIAEIEDADTRVAAIPVLGRIDTPESSKVLADWALSSDARVKVEAAEALAKYHERSRNAAALLEGSIKPDDLLVGNTAYVWDGENYVPEETAVKEK
ncbi:MAG: HEAT repeat domain-containing protein [Candidatus Poribacteria bacterium]|nr:HEAT repeat domain-containing protein [Candidatus Poribacteria bacterium]MDE0503952.1 HEAT repeat domain-containing protein [Candidatus Poribacteria bacterium]